MTLVERNQAGEALQDLGRTKQGKGRTGIWRNEAKGEKRRTGDLAERSQAGENHIEFGKTNIPMMCVWEKHPDDDLCLDRLIYIKNTTIFAHDGIWHGRSILYVSVESTRKRTTRPRVV